MKHLFVTGAFNFSFTGQLYQAEVDKRFKIDAFTDEGLRIKAVFTELSDDDSTVGSFQMEFNYPWELFQWLNEAGIKQY